MPVFKIPPRHIWGDAPDCSGGDLAADTPNAENASYGKPTFPHISCNNGPHGDMFMNYKDNTDDDAMVMLTTGQVARMHAALEGPPRRLWTGKQPDDKARCVRTVGTGGTLDSRLRTRLGCNARLCRP